MVEVQRYAEVVDGALATSQRMPRSVPRHLGVVGVADCFAGSSLAQAKTTLPSDTKAW